MGIHGFANFFSSCYKEKELSSYLGKTMVVDGKFQLIRYGIGIRETGQDMFNMKGEVINHIHAIMAFSLLMLRLGIKPVYIFDGKPPEIKRDTIDLRNSNKNKAHNKLSDIEDKNSKEYIKQFKRSYSVSNEQIKECYDLLDYIGIPYITANGEADPYCANLCKNKEIYGIISNDSDILVFGAKTLLKDFTGKGRIKEISLEDIYEYMKYKANEIRVHLELDLIDIITHENFIDFAILLGTDYISHIKGFSADQLFEYFVQGNLDISKTIEIMKCHILSLPKSKFDYYIPDNFVEKAIEVKKYYQTTDLDIDINYDISPKPNSDKLYHFLRTKNLMDETPVNNFIKELEQLYYALYNYKSDTDLNFNSFSSYRWSYYKKHQYDNNKSKYDNNKSKFDNNKSKYENYNNMTTKRIYNLKNKFLNNNNNSNIANYQKKKNNFVSVNRFASLSHLDT